MKLYSFRLSGNCYKVRLLLAQLKQPYELVELNLRQGETKTPEFLTKSPLGKLPVLETEDGRILLESNAILYYLADGTEFLPTDRFEQVQVLQWLFFEQYSIVPNIGAARFWISVLRQPEQFQAQIAQKQELGYAALAALDQHLSSRKFMVADRYTIADLSLYAYTHVAPEGGFDLSRFPAVQAWLDRVAQQPETFPLTLT